MALVDDVGCVAASMGAEVVAKVVVAADLDGAAD